ncbi:ubiquitin-specific protease otu1 [Ancistrocladus abbreviatus]
MENQDKDSSITEPVLQESIAATDVWDKFRDDDIMQQQSAIRAEEAAKIPFVGDKEHIMETQDKVEVDRIVVKVEECRKTLQSLGYADFTFEDFFALFLEQLESVIQEKDASISHDELVHRSRDQSISDYIVMFFRFVTSGEIRKRSEFFEPFILGLTNATVDQFCKSSVEPMGEESDHVHITALSDALGVPIRVVYLDRSSCDAGGVSVNHHDFIPTTVSNAASAGRSEIIKPFITLLYRPGHYDILYPK